jgi:hypothetical protein
MTSGSAERGVAIVLVLLATALLAAVALGLSLSTVVVRLTATNYEESIALLNAGESAIELAARELALLDIDDVLEGTSVSTLVDGPPGPRTTADGLSFDLLALTNLLSCAQSAPCADAQVIQTTVERPWGANNPRWRLFLHQPLEMPVLPRAALPVYVVVWIADDARETDADPAVDGAGTALEGRYIVRARAEAFGPRGGRRALEAELARLCQNTAAGEECVPGSRVQSWRVVDSVVP